jgi:flagellar basal body-associated protein FliL
MATNRMESTKPADAAGKPPGSAGPARLESAPGGRLRAWLPLILALVAMPPIAYFTTTWFILPKAGPMSQVATPNMPSPGVPAKKVEVVLKKVLVNVAGASQRFLLAEIVVSGTGEELRKAIDTQRSRLIDLASSTLAAKTLSDLEKPGARNQLRSELSAGFNHCLGQNLVEEVFFTEFAIQ